MDPCVVCLHRATLRMSRALLKTFLFSILCSRITFIVMIAERAVDSHFYFLFFLKPTPADQTVRDSGTTGTSPSLHCWLEWVATLR